MPARHTQPPTTTTISIHRAHHCSPGFTTRPTSCPANLATAPFGRYAKFGGPLDCNPACCLHRCQRSTTVPNCGGPSQDGSTVSATSMRRFAVSGPSRNSLLKMIHCRLPLWNRLFLFILQVRVVPKPHFNTKHRTATCRRIHPTLLAVCRPVDTHRFTHDVKSPSQGP